MIINMNGGSGGSTTGFPEFTYDGDYQLLDDGDKNWRIKFLTSGTLNISKLAGATDGIDVFCVGGGGGGAGGTGYNSDGAIGGGGGGGYTKTTCGVVIEKNMSYTITIGAGGSGGPAGDNGSSGGSTSAFNITANGGGGGYKIGGTNTKRCGGNGGSGGGSGRDSDKEASYGSGGTDGGKGGGTWGGTGQGTTTREFAESTGTLYASGGAGSSFVVGAANTGNGGGGARDAKSGVSGGSGIVVIRNKR